MKTYILRLEPHDDFVSTRDKMEWAKAERILLVWPPRGRVLTRQLDLVLLHRHAQSLGARLTLVTRDREVRTQARQLGIPTFSALRKAQRARWWAALPAKGPRPNWPEPLPARRTRELAPPERPRPLPLWLRAAAFTLGVLAILALSAVLVPAAQVRLAPQREAQTITLNINASPETVETSLTGPLPARWQRIVVEGRASQPVGGSILVPQERARGRVFFTNLTQETVRIPAGTTIRSGQSTPVRFVTTQPGNVPAGPGATLGLPVEAVTPGESGNLPAGRLTAIEGGLGLVLSANNLQPTTGGSDRRLPAPDQNDRDNLLENLTADLEMTALNELEQGLAPGDVLISASLRQVEVLDTVFQPQGEQPADQIELSQRLAFEALVVSQADLQTMALSSLDATLPEGYRVVPETLEVAPLTEPVLTSNQTASFEIEAARQIEAVIPTTQVINLVMGLPPATAARQLARALPLETSPEVVIQPSWWPRLPLIPLRVQVQLDAPGQALTPAGKE